MSTVTARYGSYTFDPVPQVGIRDSFTRAGQIGLGQGYKVRTLNVEGEIQAENIEALQAEYWLLEAELSKNSQIFYWEDNTAVRINRLAEVVDFTITPQWGQYKLEYSIQLRYTPLNEAYTAPFTVQLGSHVFNPAPVMSRDMSVQKNSENGSIISNRFIVRLSGHINAGSQIQNEAAINSIISELVSGATLTYGNFVQTVEPQGFNHPPVVGNGIVPYSIELSYVSSIEGGGVSQMDSILTISRDGFRYVHNPVPFVDGLVTQNLGRLPQNVTSSGQVEADTLANAKTAAYNEFATLLPAGGFQERSSRVTEHPRENRVEWTVSKIYPTPVFKQSDHNLYGDIS